MPCICKPIVRWVAHPAFLLQNGIEYMAAHTFGLLEFFVEAALVPRWKTFRALQLLGVTLVVSGQLLRSLAMVHASTNFSHTVAHAKREDHVLVTHGVYSFARHPSYAGFLYWAVGTQILLGNPVSTVLFIMVLTRFFARRIQRRCRVTDAQTRSTCSTTFLAARTHGTARKCRAAYPWSDLSRDTRRVGCARPPFCSRMTESSIQVAVRIRPLNAKEVSLLAPVDTSQPFQGDGGLAGSPSKAQNAVTAMRTNYIRNILSPVDDRVLVFDPAEPVSHIRGKNTTPSTHMHLHGNGRRARDVRYAFDRVFPPPTTQQEVYANTVERMLPGLLNGFNASVFAYGVRV